jgi:hypothetical protein
MLPELIIYVKFDETGKIIVGNSEGKSPLGRARRRCDLILEVAL